MSRLHTHNENHLVKRIGWLRAAVLGANDGIVSTASLIVGVASASATSHDIFVVGVAGIVAGAMSMAAGEYVSVSSQSDTEQADLTRERKELHAAPEAELNELTNIYISRGVDAVTAHAVAKQLTLKDALGAHAREELGISDLNTARPIQAAFTSAATFTAGALLPLITVLACPAHLMIPAVSLTALIFLGLLGAIGAKAGGADPLKATMRVMFWGALALALTAGIGTLFGTPV